MGAEATVMGDTGMKKNKAMKAIQKRIAMRGKIEKEIEPC
jgi:hypothetical protein